MQSSTILVLNTGSSSLKFSLIQADDQKVIFSGLADKLGHQDATITFNSTNGKTEFPLSPGNHKQAVAEILLLQINRDLPTHLPVLVTG